MSSFTNVPTWVLFVKVGADALWPMWRMNWPSLAALLHVVPLRSGQTTSSLQVARWFHASPLLSSTSDWKPP